MSITSGVLSGQQLIVGAKLETGDYGIPVTVGSGNGLYAAGLTITATTGNKELRSFEGSLASDLIPTDRRVDGQLTLEPRYSDMLPIISAMGLDAPGFSGQAIGAGFYEHIIESSHRQTRTPDYFDTSSASPATLRSRYTLIAGKSGQVFQIDGCFSRGFTLQSSFNQTRMSIPFTGRFFAINDAANTSVSSVTLPASNELKMVDATVYLKPLEGLVLTTSKTFTLSDAGGSATITVPAGGYSWRRLASYLTTECNQDGTLNGRYQIRYDSAKRRFIVESDINSTITTTGTIMSAMGFTSTSSSKKYHVSAVRPVVGESDFGSGHKIAVTSLEVSYANGDSRKSNTYSDPWLDEPVRGVESLSVTLTLPRYSDHYIVQEGSDGGTFEISIVYSDPDSSEKFEIRVPCASVVSVNKDISGPGVVPITIVLQAVKNRYYFNPVTLDYGTQDHLWRTTGQGLTGGDTVTALGYYKGHLHIGAHTSGDPSTEYFKRVENNALSADLGSFGESDTQIRSMVEHRGKLYLSCANNSVYSWDGASLTSVYSSASAYFVQMVSWNGLLWGIESNGPLKSYDGTSWTLQNTFSGATAGYGLVPYDGNLYCLVKNTNTYLYKFVVGTGAVLVHDFGGDYPNAHITTFDGYVYAVANLVLVRYDGTSKVTDSVDNNARQILSYNGQLLFVSTDDTGVWYYDFENGQYGSAFATLQSSPTGNSIVFGDKLLIPAADTITCLVGVPLFTVFYKNKIANPMG